MASANLTLVMGYSLALLALGLTVETAMGVTAAICMLTVYMVRSLSHPDSVAAMPRLAPLTTLFTPQAPAGALPEDDRRAA